MLAVYNQIRANAILPVTDLVSSRSFVFSRAEFTKLQVPVYIHTVIHRSPATYPSPSYLFASLLDPEYNTVRSVWSSGDVPQYQQLVSIQYPARAMLEA